MHVNHLQCAISLQFAHFFVKLMLLRLGDSELTFYVLKQAATTSTTQNYKHSINGAGSRPSEAPSQKWS